MGRCPKDGGGSLQLTEGNCHGDTVHLHIIRQGLHMFFFDPEQAGCRDDRQRDEAKRETQINVRQVPQNGPGNELVEAA